MTEGNGKIRVYECARIETPKDVSERLREIAAAPPVTAIVGLPEIHLKAKLEAPSSVAIATRDLVSAQLSSPSPNCGMAVLALDLGAADAATRIDELFGLLRGVIPMRRSPYELARADAIAAMKEGADFTRSRFDELELPLSRVDDGGRQALLGDAGLDVEMPDSLIDVARRDYGALGGGNHFLELQTVAEVLDPAAAAAYGFAEGQLAIHYHTGSGMFGYEIGRLYAYRRKVSPRLLPRIMARKLVFHAAHAGGPAGLARRYRLFVEPKRFSWVEAESPEGEEMLAALALATNFGYANRSAIATAAAAAVGAVFGDTGVRLVYDSDHNSITQEDGRWIHRHNAVRCVPGVPGDAFDGYGAPVLVPGLDLSSSYICRPGAAASAALDSVDHGAGGAVKALGAERDDGRVTTRYRFSGAKEEAGHVTDDGIDCVVATLAAADLAHPVARMTPLAVLKE